MRRLIPLRLSARVSRDDAPKSTKDKPMKVESTVIPEVRGTSKGLILANFNVEQVMKEDGTVMYQYEQLRFAPPISDEAIEKAVVKRIDELKVKVITPLQAKLQLHKLGMLDEVEAMVANDTEVRLYWEYALVIERNHPVLQSVVQQLGLTDAQVDEMFAAASKL